MKARFSAPLWLPVKSHVLRPMAIWRKQRTMVLFFLIVLECFLSLHSSCFQVHDIPVDVVYLRMHYSDTEADVIFERFLIL